MDRILRHVTCVLLFTWMAFSLGCGGSGDASVPKPPTAPAVAVSVTPRQPAIDQGGTLQFSATVTGASDLRVLWSITEGATGGTITADGVYAAPAHSGTFHVVATSQADPSRTAVATVGVPDIRVFLEPRMLALLPGTTHQFSAAVFGTVNKSVTWDVQEGTSGGVVSLDGSYTAPADAGGPFHVVAASAADPARTASADVWVESKGFSAVGDMVIARTYHTATRLQNGTVLIAGGAGQAGSPDPGAEIFDPVTATFRKTAAMSEVRFGHTATLLANGKVLIVGGKDEIGLCVLCGNLSSATAEIYDPGSETFSTTGGLAVPRTFHTATLLPDGRVVIAGGIDLRTRAVSSALEIYDPATGRFSGAPNMGVSRVLHTATLLENGTVAVAGGEGSFSRPFTVEVFDPASSQFVVSTIAPRSRTGHTATLLGDGRILMAGGGIDGANYSQSRTFTPSNGRASGDIAIFLPRMQHTATLLPGADPRVLLTGGRSNDTPRFDAVEFFDPATATFRPTLSMLRPRSGHAATLLMDGRILITGGSADRMAEIY